jgi:hypothetical protein
MAKGAFGWSAATGCARRTFGALLFAAGDDVVGGDGGGANPAARPGDGAEPREVAGGHVTGFFPPAPNCPGCARFTNCLAPAGAGGCTGGGALAPAPLPTVTVIARAAENVKAAPGGGAATPTKMPGCDCIAAAQGTYARRIRRMIRAAAVLAQ